MIALPVIMTYVLGIDVFSANIADPRCVWGYPFYNLSCAQISWYKIYISVSFVLEKSSHALENDLQTLREQLKYS